jgi:hypothetical protein
MTEKIDEMLDPNLPSLEQALRDLAARPEVPPKRLIRVRTAVAATGRVLGKPPTELPAHINYLLRQFQRVKHRPKTVVAKTISNTKSELRYLIATVYGRGRRSELVPLAPSWLHLKQVLDDDSLWWNLSRLAANCSAQGIAPASADDAVIVRFEEALEAGEVLDSPRRHVRVLIRAWNRCAVLPGWPPQVLTLPPAVRPRWSLVPAAFPASLQADVVRWRDRLAKVDPMVEDGPRRAAQPITIESHARRINLAASALVASGFPIEHITGLAVLVEPVNLKALLRVLLDRRGGKTSGHLYKTATVLKAIARHHVKLDADQLRRVGRIIEGLKPDDDGLGKRTAERLAPFEDDRMLGALLHLPKRLIEEAERPKTKARDRRVLAQVAVAIELELLTAFRRKNLASLQMGRHIQVLQVRGRRVWHIAFPRSEIKNRALLLREIPAESVALIERAMRLYKQPDGWLFPGRNGRPKSPNTLATQVGRVVSERLGVPFNLHLFRALVVTEELKENPDVFETSRAMLGDRDDAVIRASYSHVAERHQIRRAQATILNARLRTEPLVPPPSRPRTRKAS